MARKFSSISVDTALAAAISNTATTFTVTTGTGSTLMGGVTLAAGNVDQFMVAIDPDTVNEELVAITAVTSDTFTVVRGQGGTSAISHTSGAKVRHVFTGDDATAFEATTQALPGKVGLSAFTAKGDLLAGAASGVATAVPVGTDGQVLTADAASTGGVKWDTPSTPSGNDGSLAATLMLMGG